MSYRKSIAWRQKSYHWTDNEWPYDHGAKWTVTAIVLQSRIMLKASHIKCWRNKRECLENQPYLDIFLWSTFRSPVFISVILLIQMISPLYFIHVWLRVDLVFASTARYLVVLLCFFFFEWKRKKQERQVGFKGM